MDREKYLPSSHRILWTGLLLLLFLLPLVFSPSLYRSFETAKASLLRMGIVLLLLGWSIIYVKEKGFHFFSLTPIIRALLLFLLSFFLSTVLSIEPTLSIFGTHDRQFGLIGLLAITCFSLLLIEGINRGGKKNSVLRVMVLSGTIFSLYGLLQYFGLDLISWSNAFGNRPSSTLGNPVFLGEVLAMTIPFALSLCYYERSWRMKNIWILSLLVQFGGLLVSQTRGAWIAVLVSIPTFFLIEPFLYRKTEKNFRKKLISSLLILSLILSLGISCLLLKTEFRYRAASILQLKEHSRIYLWRDSLKVIREHPILGSGPETFRLSFMPHKSLELARMEKNVNWDNPHNNYLNLWASTGTLGIITYLFLLFCCFRAGIRGLKKEEASFSPVLYLGIITSLEAYCVAMLTGFDTISTIFCLYGIIAVLAAGESQLEKKVRVNGRSFRRYGLLIISILLTCLTLYDTSRVLLADHLALKGIKLLRENPPRILEARDILKRSCNLLPRESFYRLQLGMVYLKIGQKERENKEALREAIHWGNQSLRHSWAPENSHNLISISYLYLRDYHRAEQACRQGLEIDPYNCQLRTNLAISLSCQGKSREALNEAEKALSVDPDYSPARGIKGTSIIK